MARLSHDMTEDEVRDEYEWMVLFMAAMAESIRGTKDVHSLAAYVRSLERENAELKEQTRWMAQTDSRWEAAIRDLEQAKAEDAKLRELVDELYPLADYGAMDASELDRAHDLMRELGIETS